jgi:anti-sigma factor RsiW
MSNPARLTEHEREELVAFLDGELDADATQRMEAKLQSDLRFRTEADDLRKTWDLLGQLPPPALSNTLADRTLHQLTVLDTPNATWRGPSSKAIAFALGLLGAAGVGYALTPSSKLRVDLDRDPIFQSEPRLIENLPLYLAVENIEYLQSLDTIDLFGEDAVGR